MIRSGLNVACLVESLIASAALWTATCGISQEVGHVSSTSWPGAELFTNQAIRRVSINLAPEAVTSLQKQAREYVPATVVEGGNTYSNVAIHLKGSVGSFRPFDDKPALTLDFSRFNRGQKFHGLRKIHLNNSVEDPSYVNEIIGGELFNSAGVPSPRGTRVLVTLNGRARGLYVLKEGFTEDFLSCHFKHISDQLHEPENGSDIDQPMKRNSVFAPAGNRAALKELADAALDPEPARRWQRLTAELDLERFLTFMSLEIMLGHRDGYCMARNNFRVYHDSDTDRIVFLPHGMDQLFGTADLPWQPNLGGLVARAAIDTAEGRQRYADRFGSLLTNRFNLDVMTKRVDQLVQELRPVLAGSEWIRMRDEAETVKGRMVQRRLSLLSQLSQPATKPLEFASGSEQLVGWRLGEATAKGKMDNAKSPDGRTALHIVAAGETAASWTTKALVPRGRYRFEGRVKIASVQPLPYGIHHGAGLRIRGNRRQTDSFIGDSAWRQLAAEFQVEQTAEEVEFVCELRATGGEAWFELNSLRVLKLGDL